MKTWRWALTVGIVTAAVAAPVAACCGSDESSSCDMAGDSAAAVFTKTVSTEGAMALRVNDLRWELYALNRSDVATSRDRMLKRSEYETAVRELSSMRLARARLEAVVAQSLRERPAARLASAASAKLAK